MQGKTIKIGESIIANVSDEAEQVIKGRDAFIGEYCRLKGWDRSKLSLDQILEIRRQEGWKNPTTSNG